MSTWIVFKAAGDEYGWENRKFAHSNSLTNIICEQLDYSKDEIPAKGYRPPVFSGVDSVGSRTHYRDGDWAVETVEVFTPDIPLGTGIDTIVICWCEYDPIEIEPTPMPDRIISADSFGGDTNKYQEYLYSQKVPTTV